jgi:hypothetical protein
LSPLKSPTTYAGDRTEPSTRNRLPKQLFRRASTSSFVTAPFTICASTF